MLEGVAVTVVVGQVFVTNSQRVLPVTNNSFSEHSYCHFSFFLVLVFILFENFREVVQGVQRVPHAIPPPHTPLTSVYPDINILP